MTKFPKDMAEVYTDMKIIEIANAVGYENQGKFASVFAKEYGATPLEFRRFSVNEIRG
mgnify:FL=1